MYELNLITPIYFIYIYNNNNLNLKYVIKDLSQEMSHYVLSCVDICKLRNEKKS